MVFRLEQMPAKQLQCKFATTNGFWMHLLADVQFYIRYKEKEQCMDNNTEKMEIVGQKTTWVLTYFLYPGLASRCLKEDTDLEK